jgi:hypothetical protein
MTKRMADSTSSKTATLVASSDSLKGLEQQVIAIAEQLGRLAGTAQAKADGWLDQPAFQSQLTRIRDRAADLLGRLTSSSESNGATAKTSSRQRSREKVAAPGKKHRKPAEQQRGIKHSDQKISKAIVASRRKSARPRQG